MSPTKQIGSKKRIVVLGGGFGGAFAAKRLGKLLSPSEYEITLIDRNNYLLFYPLLVEAGVGSIEARHVVVPIRKFLPRIDLRMAETIEIDTESQQVGFRVNGSETIDHVPYDHLIFALGSINRKLPIPGLVEHGFELKTLVDAIGLRDRAIRQLELANTIEDPEHRKALLTYIVIGANFTGIELAGEYHSFLVEASNSYRNVQKNEIRMIVFEHGDRILHATNEKLAAWAAKTLTDRGVELRTFASVTEVGKDYAIDEDGLRIPCNTVICAAGIAPNPIIAKVSTLPVNKYGYIECERDTQVKGFKNIWAVGDCATILNAEGKPYPPTAQNSIRQGPLAAENIAASIKGQPTTPYHFNELGAFAAIGRRQAAAHILKRNVTGFLGWFLYRSVYLMKMPTFVTKLRLMVDWTMELFFGTEPVQIGIHRSGNSQYHGISEILPTTSAPTKQDDSAPMH